MSHSRPRRIYHHVCPVLSCKAAARGHQKLMGFLSTICPYTCGKQQRSGTLLCPVLGAPLRSAFCQHMAISQQMLCHMRWETALTLLKAHLQLKALLCNSGFKLPQEGAAQWHHIFKPQQELQVLTTLAQQKSEGSVHHAD